MQLYGSWYLSFSDWLSSFSISPFHFSHVIVNGFISSFLMTEWCRSGYIYHIVSAHSSVDGHLGSIHSFMLLITLLPTLGCVSLFESTKQLLYPWGKYLAVQFWNRSVALFLTSFFKIFFMIVTEGEAETQAEGEAGSMHREPAVGFDPGSPGSRPGPKAGAKQLRHPGIPHLRF